MTNTSGGDFVPLVELQRPDGTSLTSDADSPVVELICPSGPFSCTRLDANGTFRVLVSDSGNDDVGTYDVRLALVSGANEGGVLPNGGRVRGAIDLGDLDSYTFVAEPGHGFHLRLADTSGSAFHPALYLYGPNGEELTNDGDASVADIVCPSAAFSCDPMVGGIFTVVVADSSAGNAGTGQYDLYFARATGASEGGLLSDGADVLGEIELGDLDSYTFGMSAGGNFTLTATRLSTAGGFVAQFFVYNPDGTFLADGSIQSQPADLICPHPAYSCTVTQSGLYTIVVFSNDPEDVGTYRLELDVEGEIPIPVLPPLGLAALLAGVAGIGAAAFRSSRGGMRLS